MKFLFFVVLFCFSLCCFSQKIDYLIKNSGDTVWGNISLRNNIFYIANTNTPGINAEEVKKIKSVNYKGSTVVHCKLQLYSDNIDDLELDWIRKGVIDTVMILDEIYSSPKINLYFGKSDFKTQFYFYKTPTDKFPVQLVVRYYLQGGLDNFAKDPLRYKGEKAKVNIVEDKGYVNQLYAIMGDCKKIPETMWEILTYRDYSLKQVIKRYNRCK